MGENLKISFFVLDRPPFLFYAPSGISYVTKEGSKNPQSSKSPVMSFTGQPEYQSFSSIFLNS